MRRLAVALLGLAVLAGCGGAAAPGDGGYTFDPEGSAVDVGSASLRELKAQAGIAPCPATEAAGSAEGLPDITLPCLGGGRPVHLAGLVGRPTVVNFWSQTCGPCRTEAPIFQQVHEQAGDAVRILGVDWQDPQPERALKFALELGLTYPQVADPEAATRAPLHVSALPITLFVDADGAVTHTEFGAVDSVDELTDLIQEHLGTRVGPEAAR